MENTYPSYPSGLPESTYPALLPRNPNTNLLHASFTANAAFVFGFVFWVFFVCLFSCFSVFETGFHRVPVAVLEFAL